MFEEDDNEEILSMELTQSINAGKAKSEDKKMEDQDIASIKQSMEN